MALRSDIGVPSIRVLPILPRGAPKRAPESGLLSRNKGLLGGFLGLLTEVEVDVWYVEKLEEGGMGRDYGGIRRLRHILE